MLKNFFSRSESTSNEPSSQRIPLAAAVLLIEIARVDGDFSAAERESIRQVLRQRFALDGDAGEELIRLAEDTQRQSADLHQFTSQINRNFSQDEKQEIIESFWALVFADGYLDAHEDAVMHQLGHLIGLSHRQLIDAKIKVRKELESAGS